jgi:hypothetical protein
MLQHIWGRRSSWAFAAVLVVVGSTFGCGDDSNDNDNDNGAGSGAGGSRSGGSGGSSAGGSGGERSDITPSDKLEGKAKDCQSFTPVEGDKCQGWFCAVTEDELKAEVDPKARCGGDIGLLCSGTVTIKVGECARKEKTAAPGKSGEELRQPVRDCANEDPVISEKVPLDCLDCMIDVAACAEKFCLTPCFLDDNAECDACRLENKCDDMVFACGQLPSPLE